jgi:hypothetical protein
MLCAISNEGLTLGGSVVKLTRRIVAIVGLLCVALVNAEVLRAVHVDLHHGRCEAADVSPARGESHSRHHHDPGKCTICMQLASAKAVPLTFTAPIGFVASPAEEPVFRRLFFSSGIRLSSLSPRGPPFVS